MTEQTQLDNERRQQVNASLIALLTRILPPDTALNDDTLLVDELGLSSVVALYLLLELEEELEIHIPVEDFYQFGIKTVGDLTTYIVEHREVGPGEARL